MSQNDPERTSTPMMESHVSRQPHCAGSVGTGWNAKSGRELRVKLESVRVETSPVAAVASKPGRWSNRSRAGSSRWVEPTMVVEVAFAEWTPDDHVRHATFRGVRADKVASEVRREQGASD